MAGIANGVSDANINVGQEAWMGAVVGAVGGAISGAVGGSGLGNLSKLAKQGTALRTGLSAAFTVAGGTLAGAGSSTTNALLRKKPWNQVLVSAATGAVFGGAAAAVGAGVQYGARKSPTVPLAPGLTRQSLGPANSMAGISGVLRAQLQQQTWQSFWYGTAQQAPPFIVANQINGAIKAGDPSW